MFNFILSSYAAYFKYPGLFFSCVNKMAATVTRFSAWVSQPDFADQTLLYKYILYIYIFMINKSVMTLNLSIKHLSTY